jgi:hypothetical protein
MISPDAHTSILKQYNRGIGGGIINSLIWESFCKLQIRQGRNKQRCVQLCESVLRGWLLSLSLSLTHTHTHTPTHRTARQKRTDIAMRGGGLELTSCGLRTKRRILRSTAKADTSGSASLVRRSTLSSIPHARHSRLSRGSVSAMSANMPTTVCGDVGPVHLRFSSPAMPLNRSRAHHQLSFVIAVLSKNPETMAALRAVLSSGCLSNLASRGTNLASIAGFHSSLSSSMSLRKML